MAYTKLHKALQTALTAHEGHWRRGDNALPYFVHPIDVLVKVRHLGHVTSEDVLCAAILHDVLEDTEITGDEIEAEFGPVVRRLVEQLTRRWVDPSTPNKGEIEFQMLLEDLDRMEPDAQRIKLADRLANVSESVRTQPDIRTARYAEEALRMLEVIPRSVAPELWDLLSAVATESANVEKP